MFPTDLRGFSNEAEGNCFLQIFSIVFYISFCRSIPESDSTDFHSWSIACDDVQGVEKMIFASGFDLAMLMLFCFGVGVIAGLGWAYEKYLLRTGVFKNEKSK